MIVSFALSLLRKWYKESKYNRHYCFTFSIYLGIVSHASNQTTTASTRHGTWLMKSNALHSNFAVTVYSGISDAGLWSYTNPKLSKIFTDLKLLYSSWTFICTWDFKRPDQLVGLFFTLSNSTLLLFTPFSHDFKEFSWTVNKKGNKAKMGGCLSSPAWNGYDLFAPTNLNGGFLFDLWPILYYQVQVTVSESSFIMHPWGAKDVGTFSKKDTHTTKNWS